VNAATKVNTTTALASSQNPSTFGQSVTFTATVTPASGTTVPTGSVSFADGANSLGSPVTLDATTGKATLPPSVLSAGSHTITASYVGDATFNGNLSNTVTQVINKADTSTVLTSSPNPSGAGQSVTLAATVTSTSGASDPLGSATFSDGGNSLGSVALLHAKAMLGTAALAVGNHNITATYPGDSNYNSSTSSPVAQTVGDFTVSVQESSLALTAGQNGTLRVTVTPVNGLNQTVNISCSGLPVNSSCGGAPVTLDGVHASSTTVSIMTKSNAPAPGSPRRPATPIGWIFSPVGIAALAALGLLIGFSRRQRMRLVLACGVVFVAAALLSCSSSGNSGGGGNPTGTPPGTYSVTITGAAGADVHNAPNTIMLTVN
jgi:hypothetical protein